ncbi:NADH dehydrogenase [ubiquinone] 1 alpha subcomplex subunit 8 [Tribolium castaneum]|uniref:NADH dehydrogenase [ubiquinone] 1 alpha subcomplex subunit 8 n=1 Tax=Tribolium castaneum TaxID=7070 RepID=D6WT78_TRICA|nr:PREDICTED: NADH dehydrogenase [ubiquinone] 1 alpha subcomplex subunit 8 [Tribolium castaneum]EFA07408.1 NADH dehydrogenase (ubiquinone) 1 alpha subcomplex, 8 [Tribolium castaneum]|eukprot:XP_974546.1 PREDICTED: NADH dehydrogenase [ubiquinone] 1 alpha subcomplex subunit 8 [Tribolium castaneum]
MGITNDVNLPTEEELTVQEVNLSGPVLKAAAFHLGRSCLHENNEFMLCRNELGDPRKCVEEGKAVTSCALNFFRQVKKTCAGEFMQYVNCIDKSSPNQQYTPCRKTQAVFDKCAKDNMGIERLPFDHYARVQIHKTARPRPPVEGPAVYPDATPYLPEGAEKPPAKHGSRYIFMN